MRIYLAISIGYGVNKLDCRLRSEGYEVYTEMPDTPLEDPDERDVFAYRTCACASADLVVYQGPGQEGAAFDLGVAWTAGVPIWGIVSTYCYFQPTARLCVERWFKDEEALIEGLRTQESELCM